MEAFMKVMDQQEKLNQENVQRHNEQEEWEAQLENLNADVEHNPAADLPTQQSVVGNQTLDESADDGKGKQITDVPVEEKASAMIPPKKETIKSGWKCTTQQMVKEFITRIVEDQKGSRISR